MRTCADGPPAFFQASEALLLGGEEDLVIEKCVTAGLLKLLLLVIISLALGWKGAAALLAFTAAGFSIHKADLRTAGIRHTNAAHVDLEMAVLTCD